jgi:hypothetical protein
MESARYDLRVFAKLDLSDESVPDCRFPCYSVQRYGSDGRRGAVMTTIGAHGDQIRASSLPRKLSRRFLPSLKTTMPAGAGIESLAERGGQPPGTPKADKNQQLIPVDEISVYQ